MMSKSNHDDESTSWPQNYVMMQKVCHKIKKYGMYVMTSTINMENKSSCQGKYVMASMSNMSALMSIII